MKKLIFTFTCNFLIVFCSYAQRSEAEIALKEYFSDAEYFLAQEFYVDALSDYYQVYRRGYEENANINYKIGICYLNIYSQKQKSIEYLEKAKAYVSPKYRESSLKEKNAPIDVYLYLGNAYRINNRVEDAISSYNEYKKLLPEEETNLHRYADQQIEACNVANEFMKNPIDLVFENLGPAINKSNENYKAVVSGDGSTLVYMHRLPFYDAVYFSKNENGNWTEPENITSQIMSDGDQFVTSLSYYGKVLFLTKEDEFNSDLFISQYVDNRWTKSEPLGSGINSKYWESHASVSKDGKTLYFTSNRRGGNGDMDIYVSKLNEVGVWAPGINLGSDINTELNEDTPFITENGQTLFFSSQGFTSMGGYDIFKSELKNDSTWSIPQNLGYPISTTDDDLFYFPWKDGEIAYMARIEEDGYGATDIYKVTYPVIIDETITKQDQDETMKKQEVVESPVVPLADVTDSAEVDKEVELVVVPETKAVEISPVFFGFDKSVVTEKSKDNLDVLINLLNDYKDIRIDLLGYTDPLGPTEYNLKLAMKRASAAMNYLIDHGINAEQLKSIGKGEVDFIAINTNPDGSDNSEGRKYNRRVEFEVIGLDNNGLIIKRIDPVPEHLKMP